MVHVTIKEIQKTAILRQNEFKALTHLSSHRKTQDETGRTRKKSYGRFPGF